MSSSEEDDMCESVTEQHHRVSRANSFTDSPRLSDQPGHASISRSLAHRPLPKFVFASYFFVIVLQGFIFNSVWLRIMPFIIKEMNVPAEQSSVAAQIFLVIDCIGPIFGGLLSDTVWPRYHVIFVTSSLFFVSYALDLVVAAYTHQIGVLSPYLFGIILFIGQTSSGITHILLVAFGIEQLRDIGNDKTRRFMIRANIWFCKLGHLLSLPFYAAFSPFAWLPALLILAAGALQIPAFVIWKRYYRMNTTRGWTTLAHLKDAVKRAVGQEEDEARAETRWILDETPPLTEEMKVFQTAMLRRFVLLIIIFSTFGAFWCANFMANIVYPVQIKEMKLGNSWTQIKYAMAGYISLLILLPLLELFYRKVGFARKFSPFVAIGTGMTLTALSVGTACVTHYFYGQNGTLIHAPNQRQTKDTLLCIQYIMTEIGEMLVLTAGFDMAYAESLPYLRGTSMGMCVGLGTVFEACIYVIYYTIPPAGVNNYTWPYGMVCGILLVTVFLMYIPSVLAYRKARANYRVARESVQDEYFSLHHGSIGSNVSRPRTFAS